MGQEGYQQIGVTNEVWQKLKARKLKAQARAGHDITWDDFLLEATRKGGRKLGNC